MWRVTKEGNDEIWEYESCKLRVLRNETTVDIYIDYKGYNILMLMGVWGFEDIIQERKIEYDIIGEKGKWNTLGYTIEQKNLRLFCDLIYFFLKENHIDGSLNDLMKY